MNNAPVERDAGLQNERTVLAWQRSSLSLAGGAVLVGRLAIPAIGATTAAVGAIAELAVAMALFVVSRGSYERHSRASVKSVRPMTGTRGLILSLGVLVLAVEAVLTVAR